MSGEADPAVEEINNVFIPLPDGTRLAARIWLPAGAAASPVPAILEYLPYRKHDGTTGGTIPPIRCSQRPAMRGSGWIFAAPANRTGDRRRVFAARACRRPGGDRLDFGAVLVLRGGRDDGDFVGGFNLVQVAALRPPALKAAISIASTVDRYNDDIHYKNGCQLSANPGLDGDHALVFLAPARPGRRGRGLEHDVAGAPAGRIFPSQGRRDAS